MWRTVWRDTTARRLRGPQHGSHISADLSSFDLDLNKLGLHINLLTLTPALSEGTQRKAVGRQEVHISKEGL